MENKKITGEPAYARASADNSPPKFYAGGASCLARKTTGEPSWLTWKSYGLRLEASSIEASSVAFLGVNFSISCFTILNFCLFV